MKSEIRNITLAGFITSLLYAILVDDWSDPAPFINAILIGTLGGFLAGIFEVYVFSVGQQRLSFSGMVLLRTMAYFVVLTILIILIKARVDSWFENRSFVEHLTSEEFSYFIVAGEFKNILAYALFIIALIIFFRQLSRYLGGSLLMDLMRGRYHHPKDEYRVFLLVDLKGSTTIAEEMDQLSYYKFLNQFFRDISLAAKDYHPSIYRYVGDQLTLSWLLKTGDEYSKCLDAFFRMKSVIADQTATYLKTYGVKPVFRGTAHSGEIITGEVGDVRTQIIHMGLPMLEAAWMEKVGGKDINKLCVSEVFVSKIDDSKYVSLKLTSLPRPQRDPLKVYEIARR
jgi:adenylate cyclase